MRLSHIPPRVAAGAFIVNAGLGKLSADDVTAKGLHDMATGTYPFFAKADPQTFTKALGVSEIAIGSVLLSPFVSPLAAGTVLVGFSGGLLRMYLKTPGLTEEDGIRPTKSGTPIAKDVWMFAMGLGLMMDGLRPRRRRRARRSATGRAIKKSA